MSELQIPNYGRVQPLNIAEMIANAQNMALRQQEIAVRNKQLQQDQETDDFTRDIKRMTALKSIATDIRGKTLDMASKKGIKEGTPEFQAVLDTVSEPYRGVLNKITGGKTAGQPIHWESMVAVADHTPQEQEAIERKKKIADYTALSPYRIQEAQEIAKTQLGSKVAEQQAMMPGRIEEARALASMRGQMQPSNPEQIAGYPGFVVGPDGNAVRLPGLPEEMQARPMNEAQRYKYEKQQREDDENRKNIILNMDRALADSKELLELQKNTVTGPVSGSAPVVAIRQALGDNSIGALKKGYAKLAFDTLVSLKQAGATLGALSESEGKWIKDVGATLDAGEEVNTDMLEKGIRMLEQKRSMLGGGNAPQQSAQEQAPQAQQAAPAEQQAPAPTAQPARTVFKTPEQEQAARAIKKALKAGQITRAQAEQALDNLFGGQ